MTEPTQPPLPEDASAPVGLDSTSPLRGFITEVHEIYLELLYVGFDKTSANQIAAHMLSDAVGARGGYEAQIDIDYEDEDDEGEDLTDI